MAHPIQWSFLTANLLQDHNLFVSQRETPRDNDPCSVCLWSHPQFSGLSQILVQSTRLTSTRGNHCPYTKVSFLPVSVKNSEQWCQSSEIWQYGDPAVFLSFSIYLSLIYHLYLPIIYHLHLSSVYLSIVYLCLPSLPSSKSLGSSGSAEGPSFLRGSVRPPWTSASQHLCCVDELARAGVSIRTWEMEISLESSGSHKAFSHRIFTRRQNVCTLNLSIQKVHRCDRRTHKSCHEQL